MGWPEAFILVRSRNVQAEAKLSALLSSLARQGPGHQAPQSEILNYI